MLFTVLELPVVLLNNASLLYAGMCISGSIGGGCLNSDGHIHVFLCVETKRMRANRGIAGCKKLFEFTSPA
jgi:hypothetical protein